MSERISDTKRAPTCPKCGGSRGIEVKTVYRVDNLGRSLAPASCPCGWRGVEHELEKPS